MNNVLIITVSFYEKEFETLRERPKLYEKQAVLRREISPSFLMFYNGPESVRINCCFIL